MQTIPPHVQHERDQKLHLYIQCAHQVLDSGTANTNKLICDTKKLLKYAYNSNLEKNIAQSISMHALHSAVFQFFTA
jgi:hypothetical protein